MWGLSLSNLDLINSVIGILSAVMGAFWTIFKYGCRHLNLRKNRQLNKNKEYLDKYGEFLSEEDKECIKKRINAAVMSNVLQEKNKTLRDLKILFSKSDSIPEANVWYVLKKLRRYLYIKDGILSIILDRTYFFNYWFEKVFSITLALWGFLLILAVYLNNREAFETWRYYVLLVVVFSILVVSIGLFTNSPGKNKINKTIKIVNEMISDNK